MKVRDLLPSAGIAAHVDRLLVIEKDQLTTPFVLPLYANGVPTILFTSAKGVIGSGNAAHTHLFGQTIAPENLTLNESFILIAYFFKPFSLVSLFGVPAQELTDQPLDINLLFPKKTRELEQKLSGCSDVDGMIELLDGFVGHLIDRSKDICAGVKYAAERIMNNHSKDALAAVREELYITERTFQRLFEKNIGVSPGTYRRICQFNAAFTALNQRRYLKLSDLAFQHGYADQSHYIRAFKEFTNITPGDYLKFGS